MREYKKLLVICLFMFSRVAWSADVILNEFNAVSAGNFLNGGNAHVDDDGGRAFDTYFGRLQANGGDWFELVVITDHLDMRNFKLDIYENGALDVTLDLTSHQIWSDLRRGTIITVSEDVPSDISYNPAAGDWWINVQANDIADGLYIEASNFPVNNNNWQLRIRNASGSVVFGPVGEGVSPQMGVGNTEIFRLVVDPSSSITADSDDYDDGRDFSTFGAPNRWGIQDFNQLRTVAAESANISLLSPNGSEVLMAGTIYSVEWQAQGAIDNVLIEFSIDGGGTWKEVYPRNIGNTGNYNWFVPTVNSDQCLIRVASTTDLRVFDVTDGEFSIYQCSLLGDITGDCIVDIVDLAVMALDWLQCANPYNPSCK
jgi:hypothetical protein